MEPAKAAPRLIRAHLWRDRTPRPDRRGPWTIGRDMVLWHGLVRRGYDPAELNGAIVAMRHVAPGVCCMAPLASKRTGPPLLEQATHRWYTLQAPVPLAWLSPKPTNGGSRSDGAVQAPGGLSRVQFELRV